MGDKEKENSQSAILPAALYKCRELMTSVIEAESDEPGEEPNNEPDRIKKDAHLLAIAELNRWKQNPAGEESIISELYPEENPKFYFQTLEYALRHFDTLFEAVQKAWMQEKPKNETIPANQKEIAPTSKMVRSQVNDTLS